MPPPKVEHGRRIRAGDVEAIGVSVDRWIAIGGRGVGDDERAGRDGHTTELDVLPCDAHRGEDDGRVAHCLLDRLRGELGMLLRSSAHWSGWSQKTCTAAASWLRVVSVPAINRVAASMSSSSWAKSVAVDLRTHHVGQQVVGQRAAPVVDHVVEIVLECTPGAQDVRFVVDDVPVEDLEDVVGPVGEQMPVVRWGAKHRADDRDGVLPSDVSDHIAATRIHTLVDELGDDVCARRAEPFGRSGRERL